MDQTAVRSPTKMLITVYSKPACQACIATKRQLDKEGLEYQMIDVTKDPTAREYVESLGYLSAPVIVAGEDHWFGYRPDRIHALAQ
jgi:glutaredoxin-like protein NrdH